MWGLLQTKYTAKVAPLCFVTRGKFNREKSKDLPVRPCWTSSCKTWSSAKSVLFFFSASLTLSSVSLTLLLSLPCLLSLSGTCTLHLALKGVSLTRCLSFVKTKEGGGGCSEIHLGEVYTQKLFVYPSTTPRASLHHLLLTTLREAHADCLALTHVVYGDYWQQGPDGISVSYIQAKLDPDSFQSGDW